MCGIVGAIAERDVSKILLTGLQRLEYRGYDSAGIAIIDHDKQIQRLRTQGKVAKLAKLLDTQPIQGYCGIAHTRWATHGAPSEHNAHPHISIEEVAIVHNGIIENHSALREKLSALGFHFTSETDSEVIAHLFAHFYQQEQDLFKASSSLLQELKGAFALGIIHAQQPNKLIAIRQGSPIVIGIGIGEHFIASDYLALLPVTQRFIDLEDGDIAIIERETLSILDKEQQTIQRQSRDLKFRLDAADKGQFRHYMLKEIYEQPNAIAETLEGRIEQQQIITSCFGQNAAEIFAKIKNVHIVACGTSYHAALIMQYWLQSIVGIACQCEIASEYRYRPAIVPEDSLFVCISQSGETADTLAALAYAKSLPYLATLAICNVPESSLVKQADLILMTQAGIEVGVASTKAFSAQLSALFLLTLALAQCQKIKLTEDYYSALYQLPRLIEETLSYDEVIQKLTPLFVKQNSALFLGRGLHYPVALEGALKLKEISYIHAEAYPAGELKHGPLALIDKNFPVIVTIANDSLQNKTRANIQEVCARGAQVIVFADAKVNLPEKNNIIRISLPTISTILSPILYTIPLQLLAYHIAVMKGTDVDQPRNLAKSVTVE